MARVTVEDCLEHVENRFELVLLAAKRAHQIAMSATEPLVPRGNHKPTIVALLEIAAGYTQFEEKTDAAISADNLFIHPPRAHASQETDTPADLLSSDNKNN